MAARIARETISFHGTKNGAVTPTRRLAAVVAGTRAVIGSCGDQASAEIL